jgi:hypothetical protein
LLFIADYFTTGFTMIGSKLQPFSLRRLHGYARTSLENQWPLFSAALAAATNLS